MRCAHEPRALSNGELWKCADCEEIRFDLSPGVVSFSLKGRQGSPTLAAYRHVLAFIFADRATGGRIIAWLVLHAASAADECSHHLSALADLCLFSIRIENLPSSANKHV